MVHILSTHGKMKNGLKILVGKSEVVGPRFGPRRRWNGKIKMVGKLGRRIVEWIKPVAYPGILFGGGGGVSKNSVEDRGNRERGSEGGSPLVRGCGGSCNLVQEISFRMVKFS